MSNMNVASQPFTDSERYLGALCSKAFLSLWAHPNVYTDEGKSEGKGSGKELCDLLVVFGEDVLIFSDKHCSYKETGNDTVDWKRWYKKAITKSIAQLKGAASFIDRFPGRLFLDAACQVKFPIAIPPLDNRRIHLIAVTRGSLEAAQRFYANKSIGSLRFINRVELDDVPFAVGPIKSPWGLVHIFDEHSLDALFAELDTVADFVSYLKKRSAFLSREDCELVVDGEEQLVAKYLVTLNDKDEHDFLSEPFEHEPGFETLLYVSEGHWESLVKNPQYIAKKREDSASYMWDNLISRFIDTARNDVLATIPVSWRGGTEPVLRRMADETRFGRRILGAAFDGFLKRAQPGKRLARVMQSRTHLTRAYVFLAEPYDENYSTYEEYRDFRAKNLYAYCTVARLKNLANEVIGIAIDSPSHTRRGGSEDILYTFEPEVDDNIIAHAKSMQQELGILLPENVQPEMRHFQEFPEAGSEKAQKLSRQQRRAAERSAAKTMKASDRHYGQIHQRKFP